MRVILLMFTLFLNNLFSQVLTFEEIKNHSTKKTVKKAKRDGIMSNIKENLRLKKELNDTKKKLSSYRYIERLRINKPYIAKESLVSEAAIIGAETLGAIRATASPSTIILSNLKGSDIPSSSKILCTVIAKYKRICGVCTRLIISNKGHEIKAKLHHKDGSSCAIGKLSDDGEKYLVGIGVSELAQGALAVSQSSIPTIGGNLIENNVKNKLAQGGINFGQEASDLLKDKVKSSEPIVYLGRGEKVTVFFENEVNL